MRRQEDSFLFLFVQQLPWLILVVFILVGVNKIVAALREFLFGTGPVASIVSMILCGIFNYFWISRWGRKLFAPPTER